MYMICALYSFALSWADSVQIHRRNGEIRQDTLIYKTLSDGYKLTAIVHYPREWRPSDRRPAFVCSYGSGWKGGKYEEDPVNDTYLSRWEPKCNDLALKGMVCVRYDYRAQNKVGDFPNKETAMISDARSIVRWIRRNAEKLGVDTSRICGSGCSSGFHIMVSGTIFNGTKYDQPGEKLDMSPKANVLVGFTGALCSNDRNINGICPGDSIQKGNPPFLGIVGGNDSWRVGVEQYVAKAYKLHIPSLLKTAPGQGHDFHIGMFGHGTQIWYDSTMQWAQNFLFSIGHMDLTVECRPGDKVNLQILSQFIRDYCSIVDTLGKCEEVLYTYTGQGGNVNADGIFTSSGIPGLYHVTAKSVNYPHIKRTAIIRVPVVLAINSATSKIRATGFFGLYGKVKKSTEGNIDFVVTHKEGNSRIIFPAKSLHSGFYYLGSFLFDNNLQDNITFSGEGADNIDSIMLVPSYPGFWNDQNTSVSPPLNQNKQSNMVRSKLEEFEIYSVAGKKFHSSSLFNYYHKNRYNTGIIIVRNKIDGQSRLVVHGLFLRNSPGAVVKLK